MSEMFRVTYEDGKVETAKVRPKHRMKAELHYKGFKQENTYQASAWIVWRALRDSEQISQDLAFEAWIETVDDLEAIEDDETDAVDPPSGQPSSESSTSPSPPAWPSES